MSIRSFVAGGIAALVLAGFVWVVIAFTRWSQEQEALCTAAGGVRVSTENGAVCLRAEKVIVE